MAATVARQQPAGMMMARVDRLDLLLGYLEERMHRNGNASPPPSATTTASSPSTPAGVGGHRGLVSSDDDDSSAASTPQGSKTWRRPRPAKEVLEEAQAKGSLIDRIAFLEHRVLKMEEDMVITPAAADEDDKASHQPIRAMVGHEDARTKEKVHDDASSRKKKKKKGLKSLVKSCVRGNLKTKD
ncbi:uncharacterized protein LOC8072885 [Sorghum bicolor]|uniref:Uncharacterized protein n=1 Tax=Sorghum bicolor TaxID=4558 RepID=A0A1B6PEN3_SORBI|nr:uncharacterized protein LOC8072885 [Sorghum bicolor]KXG24152.1 hypothetical protein SORBI_3008G192100 [Sorghum bicolor]|eukprot:XP_002442627.2 uncharacterized protein LOC8072885 [Sorghum bicolor]